jgi:hypothetical protein
MIDSLRPCALLCLTTAALVCAAAAPQTRDPLPQAADTNPSAEETWGIQAVALRPTFGGRMLDFRYRVLDAAKARDVLKPGIPTYLTDPARGVALGLPGDTSIGSLRSSVRDAPVAGKQYFILFANAYGQVKRGDKVTVVLGDCHLPDLVVE